jgi:hypothetical protein
MYLQRKVLLVSARSPSGEIILVVKLCVSGFAFLMVEPLRELSGLNINEIKNDIVFSKKQC